MRLGVFFDYFGCILGYFGFCGFVCFCVLFFLAIMSYCFGISGLCVSLLVLGELLVAGFVWGWYNTGLAFWILAVAGLFC